MSDHEHETTGQTGSTQTGSAQPVPDAVDDSTIVVAHDRVPDHTVVVTDVDRTIVVPNVDRTVVVAGRGGSGAEASDATIIATGRSTSRPARPGRSRVGDPVEEDDDSDELPSGLARLFYKNPLDPKRRAPESPFPRDRSSLPRGGVRSGIPVVYGTRSEEQNRAPEGTAFAAWIGPPPAGYELPVAERGALPSTARFNRRFRLMALAGGAGAAVVAALGLWWIAGQLF